MYAPTPSSNSVPFVFCWFSAHACCRVVVLTAAMPRSVARGEVSSPRRGNSAACVDDNAHYSRIDSRCFSCDNLSGRIDARLFVGVACGLAVVLTCFGTCFVSSARSKSLSAKLARFMHWAANTTYARLKIVRRSRRVLPLKPFTDPSVAPSVCQACASHNTASKSTAVRPCRAGVFLLSGRVDHPHHLSRRAA